MRWISQILLRSGDAFLRLVGFQLLDNGEPDALARLYTSEHLTSAALKPKPHSAAHARPFLRGFEE
ncbi:hypothetical protein CO659_02335 [Rhizobium sp. S9]|nr:hypothetical protein CO659_02335 [Rhizobium sp. S9]